MTKQMVHFFELPELYKILLELKNSLSFDINNYQSKKELSNAITKLAIDDELRERLGLSGYKFVHEECNCISMAKNSLELYEQVLKNNHNNGEFGV